MLRSAIQAVVQVTTRIRRQRFFSYERLNAITRKNQYQRARATYKGKKFPTIRDTSAALEVQGTNSYEPNVA